MLSTMLENLFSLQNKVVVMTGAGGHIGGAIAQVISQCGAQVAVVDISGQSAHNISNKIRQKGGKAIAIKADVVDRNSLEKACCQIIREFGKIDCLVNGAGGNKKDATTSTDISFFDLPYVSNRWILDLNFMGTLLACQVFGKEIIKQEKGSIINVASIAGLRPLTRAAAYAAAKAAVINFTRWLAVHMCQNYSSQLRVNAIAPGFCVTKQNHYLLFKPDNELSERGCAILKAVPQNRFGEPSELTGAVVWLLSDSASFTTGAVITVDGGFSAYSGI